VLGFNRSNRRSRSIGRILLRRHSNSKERRYRLPCHRHHAGEEVAVDIAFGPAAGSSLEEAGRRKPVAGTEGSPAEAEGLVDSTAEPTLFCWL